MSEDLDELRAIKASPDDSRITALVAERIFKFSQADDDALFAATVYDAGTTSPDGQKLFQRLQHVDFTSAERRNPWLAKLENYVLSRRQHTAAAWLCHTLGVTFDEFTKHVLDQTKRYNYGQENSYRSEYEYFHRGDPSYEKAYLDRKQKTDEANAKKLADKKADNATKVLAAWKLIVPSVNTPERNAVLSKFESDFEASKAAAEAAVAAKADLAAKANVAAVKVADGASASKKSKWKFGR
jgi:hypothetical protein